MAVATTKVNLLDRLRERITQDPNSLYILVKGDLGSGKSWLSLSLCAALDPDFIDNKESRIVFSPLDFVSTLENREVPPGSMLMWDEAQTSMNPRRHMSAINVAINTQLDTMRRDNIGLVFNCPNSVDKAITRNLDFSVETVDIDMGARKTKVKFKKIQHNKTYDKIYRHYPRVNDNDRVPNIMNPLFVPAPDSKGFLGDRGKELIEYYEEARDEFQSDVTSRVKRIVAKKEADELGVEPEDLGVDVKSDAEKKKDKETKKARIKRAMDNTDLSYKKIAKLTGTSYDYVKQVGSKYKRDD